MKLFKNKGITYRDAEQANAAVQDLRDQGYYTAKAEKYGDFYKVDKGQFGQRDNSKEIEAQVDKGLARKLELLEKENELLEERLSQVSVAAGGSGKSSTGSFLANTWKNWTGKAQQMHDLDSPKRPKIARMPTRSQTPIATLYQSSPISPNAGIKKRRISYAPLPKEEQK